MEPNQKDLDNRADQLNPNNDAYYQSRGLDGRPDDWDDDDDESKSDSGIDMCGDDSETFWEEWVPQDAW